MRYALYFLQFDTSVHFGCAENGGMLEQSSITYRADTLFSALCYELALAGDTAGLDWLHTAAEVGTLAFSDLLPYEMNQDGMCLYLPKPTYAVRRQMEDIIDAKQIADDRKKMKKLKKMLYVRVSEITDFVKAVRTGERREWKLPNLGEGKLSVRVNRLEEIPRPYYVHDFTFVPHAGLYGIIGYEDADKAKRLMKSIEYLGLSGIGGKRSSGYGKFHFRCEPVRLDENSKGDMAKLYKLLSASDTSVYMSLSCLLPQEAELDIVKGGQYSLCRRSGFLSPDGRGPAKKSDVYMLEAGACLSRKINGSIADLGGNAAHPVWRYGKGLFAGVAL